MIILFKYWRWEQRNPDPAITSGSWFLMTNLYLLQCSIEEYYFKATVAGNQIPDVTCYSSLKAKNPPTTGQPTQPPQTTQPPRTTQSPATTQQPPATTEPGWALLSIFQNNIGFVRIRKHTHHIIRFWVSLLLTFVSDAGNLTFGSGSLSDHFLNELVTRFTILNRIIMYVVYLCQLSFLL